MNRKDVIAVIIYDVSWRNVTIIIIIIVFIFIIISYFYCFYYYYFLILLDEQKPLLVRLSFHDVICGS